MASFPGGPGRQSATEGMNETEAAAVRAMQGAMESCLGKSIMSGVMGFALGGAFGLFMSSMSYDSSLTPASQAIANLPMRQQIKAGLKDMGQRSYSSAKNFGKIGALFTATECGVEALRAKNDMTNGVVAGCITGGILAAPGGPQAVAFGCAGFAAFSTAIEMYMRQPSEPE